MSMTKEVIRKFVEEDYAKCAILVTCDNEHRFYHNVKNNPPIIWDWDNDCFIAMEMNDEVIDQSGHPLLITTVALEEIQFLTASVNMTEAMSFINKITDEEKKKETKEMIQKLAPAMMGPRTLRLRDSDQWPKE